MAKGEDITKNDHPETLDQTSENLDIIKQKLKSLRQSDNKIKSQSVKVPGRVFSFFDNSAKNSKSGSGTVTKTNIAD